MTASTVVTAIPPECLRLDVVKLAGALRPYALANETDRLGEGWAAIAKETGGPASALAAECAGLCMGVAEAIVDLKRKGVSIQPFLTMLGQNHLAVALVYRAACTALALTQHQIDRVAYNERHKDTPHAP